MHSFRAVLELSLQTGPHHCRLPVSVPGAQHMQLLAPEAQMQLARRGRARRQLSRPGSRHVPRVTSPLALSPAVRPEGPGKPVPTAHPESPGSTCTHALPYSASTPLSSRRLSLADVFTSSCWCRFCCLGGFWSRHHCPSDTRALMQEHPLFRCCPCLDLQPSNQSGASTSKPAQFGSTPHEGCHHLSQ